MMILIATTRLLKNCRFILFLSLMTVLLMGNTYAQEEEPTESPSGDWLMFRGNPQHTGKTNLTGPPEEIELQWRWKVNNETGAISASPAVTSDGTVYIATESGFVAAIQPDGGPGWIRDISDSVASSPSVNSNGEVFVVTEDGYLHYFDSSGELKWKSDFNENIAISPVISGDTAYLGSDDKALYAIGLTPDMSGIQSESKKILKSEVVSWTFLSEGTVKSSPAFAGNTVFFGGGNFLYAVNSSGGNGDNATSPGLEADSRIKWLFDINAAIHSSPAVHNGRVYVGADDGYLYAFNENVTGDSNEGELIWKRKTGGKIRSSPAVDDQEGGTVICVGCDDGRLYAYDENGELQWTYAASGPIRSSPAIDGNGDIYFGSDDGTVYALFKDGSLKWQFGTGGMVRSSPAIGPGELLYVGSQDGYLYCIGESTEETDEFDFEIAITTSLFDIENDGNPTTVTATISSDAEGENILGRIASVTIDLTTLNLTGCRNADEECLETGPVTIEEMLDDGLFEDDLPGDGTFTYAFGLSDNTTQLKYEEGIFTHSYTDGFPGIGPISIMVTVKDFNENRTSKPFALNIANKIEDQTAPFTDSLVNRLKDQDVNISFTSFIEEPSILSIVPNQGSPGQRLTVAIVGRNTNFEKNKTRVEIRNDNETVLASARPEDDDVEVLSDTQLSATLNISTAEQIPGAEKLIGKWDVHVITEGEDAVGRDLFTITGSSSRTGQLQQDIREVYMQQEETCAFNLDAFQMVDNATVARAEGAPWTIKAEYARELIIESAQSGEWFFDITISECSRTPSFKIITKGSNFGFLVGEVRDGMNGEGIDNATVFALSGRSIGEDSVYLDIEELIMESSNHTLSSGGGFFMLPLAATAETYTVIAAKDGLFDIEREIAITDGEENELNFSLQADQNCPISDLAQRQDINLFYRFRDTVLSTTGVGRRWVTLYYKHAQEVHRLLSESPELQSKARKLIYRASLELQHFVQYGYIRGGFSDTVQFFIDTLIAQGSPELRASLQDEQEKIFTFLAEVAGTKESF